MLLCTFWCLQGNAQYDVYANQLLNNSADFQNPGRAVDANQTNYAYLSNLLTLLSTSSMQVRFPEKGQAGDVINIQVQGTGSILSTTLLDNVTIKLYDSAGTVPVATVSGSSLLKLSLLSPTENIYSIKFYTNPTASYTFKEARVEFNNVLSLSLLSQLRLYGIYFQRPCPTVYADKITGSGSGLLAYVDSVSNVTDANPNNRARMVALLDILGISATYIEVGFPVMGKGGDFVGFTATNSSALLSLSVLNGLTITTYDQTGAVKETKTGSSLLNLKLLSGTTGRYSIGFLTTPGSYRISKIRLTKTAAVGLLEDLYVYNAFYYTVNRPPVTVTTSGPTTFCEGGSVTLTAFDSLGYNNYTWSTGTTGNKLTVSTSGTYYVQVEDSVSCTRRSIPMEVVVNPNPTPVIVGDSVLCLTAAGTLSLAGTSYASRTWSTGATTPAITGLNPGKYFVTVTDTNSCKGSDTISVKYNDLVVLPTITPTTCSNTATGSISLAVTKGSGSYSYRWSTGATTSSITGLKEGLYTCIVQDNVYGCSFNRSFSIVASNSMVVKSATVNTSACGKSDGSITLTVAGGSGTYNYLWSNGGTAAKADNINAGIYTVTITDAGSGCAKSDTFGVSDGGSGLNVTPAITPSSSCSAPNGSATVSVTGGSGTYTYKWSHGGTTASATALHPGTYYVAVTDVTNGCTMTIPVVIPNSGVLNLVSSMTQPGCKMANGAISVTSVIGGSGANTYAWSTGATTSGITGIPSGTYLVTVNNAGSGCAHTEIYTLTDVSAPAVALTVSGPDCNNTNGSITAAAVTTAKYLWSTGATSKNITGLKPGTYTVMVTDSTTNCTAMQTAYVAPKIPMHIMASPANNTSCPSTPNGAISVDLTGGTAPYTYSWSSGDATKDLSGKNAGTYNLNVTDGNGCTASISVVLRTDSSKVLLAAVSSTTESSCSEASNGAAYVNVTGGTTPYTYSWTPGGAATKDLENVKAGTYTLSVTDGVGCTVTVSATITASTTNPLIAHLDSVKNVGCLDTLEGRAYVSTSGGTKPYTYAWTPGGATTEDLMNVRAGNYTLTVTDSNGCKATAVANIIKLSNFAVSQDVKNISCHGDANGSISLSVSGGTGSYSYMWSDGSTTASKTGLNGGTYMVTVTDNTSKCNKALNITVTEPDALSLQANVKNDTCTSGPDGSITLMVTGGTAPYGYMWSNGANTASLFNLSAEKYTVTVTDANNCTTNGAYTVAQSDCNFTLNIHNVLTPNGDGDNDYFMIEGIQYYPNNQVQILDKWGDVVYEKRNYDNSWNGVSSKNSMQLPAGTYYYLVKLNEANKTGGKDYFTGSLLIQR